MERKTKPSAIPVSPVVPSASVDVLGDRVNATLPTGESTSVLLYGATVLSWKSSGGTENLWLSEKVITDGSKPVRGGIPIVFPVFGKSTSGPTASLPQHGFARNSKWEFLGKSTTESLKGKQNNADSSVQLDFGLSAASISPDFRKAWPFDFNLIYTVILGPSSLETSMQVQNSGTQAFEFNLLFHTYFAVNDISHVTVSGLEGSELKDKVAGKSDKEAEKEVAIKSEVDRVYDVASEKPIAIMEGGKPKMNIERQNLPNVVVWNPWEGASTKMGDFAPATGYKQMICVEPGNVSEWQKVDPGENFEATVVMRLA